MSDSSASDETKRRYCDKHYNRGGQWWEKCGHGWKERNEQRMRSVDESQERWDEAAPYDDSWEPVNAVAIPDAALRADAKAMWATRRQGDAPPATEAAAANSPAEEASSSIHVPGELEHFQH